MRLPMDLLTQSYTKPRLFLCETDKTKICQLDTTEMSGVFKFNAYSEITFTVGRTYIDMTSGDEKINPYYNKIEALRLLYLDGFGYFEIQEPEIVSDGIQEVKNVTAYSLEYTLSQKYLDTFNVNTGETDSVEVIYAGDDGNVVPVTLYNQATPELSLLHLILEKIYGWTIGHVDASLTTMSRTFEVSRASVYDFLTQDICDKFNCFVVFDTINNTINVYAESLISKFIGDGNSTTFVISPPYDEIGTVSINSYKTTAYTYNSNTGILILETPPTDGAMIEVVDGSQEKWTTDVYVTFDNLAQEVNVSYSADDIKTVLTVKGADDLDIREVNMGLPYITDISYYYTVDWMGQDLYDAYTAYLKKSNNSQSKYTENSKQMLELDNYISYETNRLSLEYSIAEHVNSTTVGTYYVRGGTYPNYYYVEVSLPSEYNTNVEHYYSLSDNDINEGKVSKLYEAIQKYYNSQEEKDIEDINALADDFAFMNVYTISYLTTELSKADTLEAKDTSVTNFLDEMWTQLGLTPLNSLYYNPYKEVEKANIEAEWNQTTNENYWLYYPVTLMLSTLNKAMAERNAKIDEYEEQYSTLQEDNAKISNDLLVTNNFTEKQLIRLNSFLREDEYTDDNFVETNSDSIEELMQTKQELLECGRIELSKLCEPKLEFSMTMANIYALHEFAPIVNQFQLGNLINVEIRSDYIKRARLLEVNINFDDFSDFSCSFGELTDLRTPSSIHADLLASAMSAGKSVASNASYWDKGSDTAIATDIKIQQGLLDAATSIKAIDGKQGVSIDARGIHLQLIDPATGAVDPKEGWIVNNQFLYSDDNFKTSKSVFGEYKIGKESYWGLLAEAVIAGYIEGSTIVGGTINIGDGTFVVASDGSVTMKASSIDGYVEEDNVISSINQSPETIAINADRISLVGKKIDLTSDSITIDSTYFKVDKNGKITATSGEIAGWTISTGRLVKQVEKDGNNYEIYVQAADGNNTSNAFAVTKKDAGSSSWDMQFSVNYEGKLTAKNADITGSITANSLHLGSGVTIPYSKLSGAPNLDMYITKDGIVGSTPSSGSTGFKVSSNGLLTASNAIIYGTVYASEGTIAGYNIGSGGSFGNALFKRVSGDETNYEVGLKASSGSSDIAFYVKESDDNWNSSSDVFYINNSGKLYAQNADITGKITASSGKIGSWNVGNLGGFTDSIYTTYCAASTPSSSNPEYAVFMRGSGAESALAIGVKQRTSSSTGWTDAKDVFFVRKNGYVKMANADVTGAIHASSGDISGNLNISGALINTNGDYSVTLRGVQDNKSHGVFYISDNSSSTTTYPVRINGDGSASFTNVSISGSSTIASACIPNLNANKITAGTLDVDRIPNLSADKITSGTISTDILSSSVITTGNFSSKSLSTGNLSVTYGGNIGVWTINSNNYLYAISGNYGVSLSPTSVSHGQGGSATWVNIVKAGQNASDDRLKKNIVGFEDKFDRIFDNVKPVKFEYSKEFLGQGAHFGYIAQDVIKAFEDEGEDINNYSFMYEAAVEDNSEDKYYQLNKSDFIALNTWQIQKLKARIEELEKKLEAL